MIFTILKTLINKNKPATHKSTDKVVETFRVWPQYVDFNMHINNANYFVFAEKARWLLFMRMGLMNKMIKHKYNFIIGAAEISYVREIRFMKKFNVETQAIGKDDKYLYVEQVFKCGDKVHAHILIKAAIVQNGKVASMQEVAEVLGFDDSGIQRLDVIEGWRELANRKRAAMES